MDDAQQFAKHLSETYLDEKHLWPSGSTVILPENVCVAVTSLLQYMVEDWKGLPESLIPAAIQLSTVIGSECYTQNPETTEQLEQERLKLRKK